MKPFDSETPLRVVALEVLDQLRSVSDLAQRAKGMSPEHHVALHCALKGAETDPFIERSAPLLQVIEDIAETVISEATYKSGTITLHALDFRERDIPIPLSLFHSSLQNCIEWYGTTDYPTLGADLHPSRQELPAARRFSVVGA